MYIPEKFKEERIEVLHALMQRHPLATLVVTGDTGIVANHLPLEALPAPAPLGQLRGHIARANPLWRQYRPGTEALAIFQGPEAYISPSFYATKLKTGEVVPTWNYAVVHVRGTLDFTHEAEWLKDFVTKLTEAHEASRVNPWKVSDAPDEYLNNMLRLIVGFEFTITHLVGKWKLSQNRVPEDREGVLQGLEASGDPESLEMAGMLGL